MASPTRYAMGLLVPDMTQAQYNAFEQRVRGLVEVFDPGNGDDPYFVLVGTNNPVIVCAAINGDVRSAVKNAAKASQFGLIALYFDAGYTVEYMRQRLEQLAKEQPVNFYRILTRTDPAGSDINPIWLPVV
jgi:hypothetical protein